MKCVPEILGIITWGLKILRQVKNKKRFKNNLENVINRKWWI